MSVTFSKLFSSITESTIWCEDSETRVVWITMLAMADRNGRVFASLPGLANRAQVPLEKTESAIRKFLSPDPYSRTKVCDGRRIEPIDGGWRLINHSKYRALRDEEERKAYKAEWIKEKRQNVDKSVDKCRQSRPLYTQADTDTDTDKNKRKTFSSDSKETRLAKLLLGKIRERKSDFQGPRNLQSWAKHIDLMIRLDGRTPEKIEKIIVAAQNDTFWQNNILSTAKLREKFDQLDLKLLKTGGKSKTEKMIENLKAAAPKGVV